jgi:hypothetical protein
VSGRRVDLVLATSFGESLNTRVRFFALELLVLANIFLVGVRRWILEFSF